MIGIFIIKILLICVWSKEYRCLWLRWCNRCLNVRLIIYLYNIKIKCCSHKAQCHVSCKDTWFVSQRFPWQQIAMHGFTECCAIVGTSLFIA